MYVLKFGGTSVGSASGIRSVRQIVASRPGRVVVVVSAMSGVTEGLVQAARQAAAGDEAYQMVSQHIRQRHLDVAEDLLKGSRREEMCSLVGAAMDELCNIYKGVYLIRELSARTLATVVGYGAQLASRLVAAAIEGAEWMDARDVIRTSPAARSKHVCDFGRTDALVRACLGGRTEGVTVIGGAVARDGTTGEATYLGRGGADYTASIVAAALDAEQLEVWTDVDGLMTADPKVISSAYVIRELSFVEAMELCTFGARVIYPPTIFPVFHKEIPIAIRNTFAPSAPGTLIHAHPSHEDGKVIRGISSIGDTGIVTVAGLGMVGVIGVNGRIFRALADAGISVFFVSQASSESSSTIGLREADAERAVAVLRREFARELELGEITHIGATGGLATVAIVGEGMRGAPGTAGKLFRILGQNGINVVACTQGAMETNISFVIAQGSLRKALGVIHDGFFLSEHSVLNVFLAGVGLVGRHLLAQIRSQQAYLRQHKNLQLRIVGLANSRRCLFAPGGIDLDNWEAELAAATTESRPEVLAEGMVGMNLFNSVFVDCTASDAVAALYLPLMQHNVSVVCANKVAASGPYVDYARLKGTARRRGVKFLFETNVGAGLPIIGTINNLINSGDEILRIEAVVSGTLNYIFSILSADVPLSRAIRMACEAGYAEPDPRNDLNASDVVRKITILAREAGYPLSREDVACRLFLPESCFAGSLNEFWQQVPQLDAPFEAMRREAEARGRRLRFVATLDGGHASAMLREVDSQHPFYHLEGSNNVILLTTARYREYPMEIKGYGAGAAVTAAGVFADIISVANIR